MLYAHDLGEQCGIGVSEDSPVPSSITPTPPIEQNTLGGTGDFC